MTKSFLFLLLIVSISVQSQKVDIIRNDGMGGGMFYQKAAASPAPLKYDKVVSGSAYFIPGWMFGKLYFNASRGYDSMQLRIDMLDNTLIYRVDDVDMKITSPVSKVVLMDLLSGTEYTFENSAYLLFPETAERGWYQVLASGKTSMYKKISKKLAEERQYGSASTEQIITTSSQYFIFTNASLVRVKKIKDIPDILSGKKEELKKFISDNRLGQADEDFGKLINHYNSLQ